MGGKLVHRSDGGWNHWTWWKAAINSLLRLLQRGPIKWVIFTQCESGDTPKPVSYGFGPIVHRAQDITLRR